MDKEKLKKLVQDNRFIPGIYNYCDRWCERCSFTSRCLNFASDEEDSSNPETRDIRNEKYWEKIGENFQVALIGVDRSIAAWGEVRSLFPFRGDLALRIMIHLETLRRKVEKAFPHAREFIRPGFDEIRLSSCLGCLWLLTERFFRNPSRKHENCKARKEDLSFRSFCFRPVLFFRFYC